MSHWKRKKIWNLETSDQHIKNSQSSFQFELFLMRSALIGDALSLSYGRVSSSHSSEETCRMQCSSSSDIALWTRRMEPAFYRGFVKIVPELVSPIYTSESGKLSIGKPVKSVGREIKVFRAKWIHSTERKRRSPFVSNIFRFIILLLKKPLKNKISYYLSFFIIFLFVCVFFRLM